MFNGILNQEHFRSELNVRLAHLIICGDSEPSERDYGSVDGVEEGDAARVPLDVAGHADHSERAA